MNTKVVVIGTRNSKLALWQTEHIKAELSRRYPVLQVEVKQIVTKGDLDQSTPLPKIGGKGLFTAELESALRTGEIDIAVHSLKDLPTELEPDFCVGAIPKRASPFDALVSYGNLRIEQLPSNSLVGSSSLRRVSQINRLRGDLRTEPVRGNVDTRLKKVKEDKLYAAIILAYAGLSRLDLAHEVCHVFSPDEMMPAPAQGALAVQIRSSDKELSSLLVPLDDLLTRESVECERAFLSALDAGCSTPVGCYVKPHEGRFLFRGRCLAPDGSITIDIKGEFELGRGVEFGRRKAEEALSLGFREFQR